MSHVFVICEVECITVQLVTQSYKLIQHSKVEKIPCNAMRTTTQLSSLPGGGILPISYT